MRRLLPLILIALSARAAFAQDAEVSPADKATAQALFDDGMRLFKDGKYADACPKFEASLKRNPGLGTRGKLAECWEKQGRIAAAWAQYREVAAIAAKTNDDRRREVAEQRAAALEARLPYLTVNVPTAAQVDGLVVKRDDDVLESSLFGSAIAVDPGKHIISATGADRVPWKQEIQIDEKEKKSVDVPVLVAAPKPLVAAPTTPHHSSKKKLAGMITVGVGAASVITGTLFGLAARSDWNSAFGPTGGCSGTICTTQHGYDLTSDARSEAMYADVFVIGGVAVAAVGTYFWWRGAHEDRESRVSVTPTAGPGGFGLSINGGF